MLKGLNDFLDKAEGKPVGSSTAGILKERKRQGYDKSKSKALDGMKKIPYSKAKNITKGIHQLGLKDEPRHKTLEGKEVKY